MSRGVFVRFRALCFERRFLWGTRGFKRWQLLNQIIQDIFNGFRNPKEECSNVSLDNNCYEILPPDQVVKPLGRSW
jgi:hypothetical protein